MVERLRNFPLWEKFTAKRKDSGEMVRCTKDGQEDRVFVFAKGKKRYGTHYMLEPFLEYYEPIFLTDEEKTLKWRKKLLSIAKHLEASGLWSDFIPICENLQAMTKKEYDEYFALAWTYRRTEEDEERLNDIIAKFPFLSDGDYTQEWVKNPVTKSMFFGYLNKETKERIALAIQNKEGYATHGYGTNYDVTFYYDAKKNRATYQEEYRGCGNGHYYYALDSSMALFCEDD